MSLHRRRGATRPSRAVQIATCLICLAASGPTFGQAKKDAGKFDGAVWTFQMTPKVPGLQPLRGAFRVSNHVLYQKETPEDPDFTKQVGKNHPRGSKTRVEFKDLRAFVRKGVVHEGLSGNVLLTIDRFGEWSGTFIDSQGRHWGFKCSRVQE
jgi:hypothetical protein